MMVRLPENVVQFFSCAASIVLLRVRVPVVEHSILDQRRIQDGVRYSRPCIVFARSKSRKICD